MLEIIKNLNHGVFDHKGFSYLLIEKWSRSIESLISDYSAVLITTQNILQFEEIIKNIRTHQKVSIFLIPLFYKYHIESESIVHTDGVFETNVSNSIIKNIQQKCDNVYESIQGNFLDDVKLKTVQYLYTRKATLIPLKSRMQHMGYSFPFIDLYFDSGNLEKIQVLSQLGKEGILQETLLNKLQLCQKCYDSFLFFKETCTKCNSLAIEAEDVIHHFPCAHVAPASQYKIEGSDQLQCPKCYKHLRHIGIDYDRPSSVYSCLDCDTNFQDPKMHAECHGCHHENKLDELIEVSINNYKLTMKGILFVEQKHISLLHKKPTENSIFSELLEKEKERLFSNGKSSFKVTLQFEGKLFTILQDAFLQQLWVELMKITETYVGGKIYQLKTANSIKLLFVDKSKEQLYPILEKMKKNLSIILEDNVGAGIKIKTTIINITTL